MPDRPVRNAFPTASEVRLFVETGYRDNDEPILSKTQGLVLNPTQRSQFESSLLVLTKSPDEMRTACFIPHHFFRYFDKAGKQVGEIAVCFCCAGVEQSGASNIALKEGQELGMDYAKLQGFVQSVGERSDVQCEGEV